MNTSIHLLVEYSPDITLKMTSESTPILEGQNLIFNCTASANPPEVSYRWFVEDEIVPEIHGNQYIIPGVGRQLNTKSVKCEAVVSDLDPLGDALRITHQGSTIVLQMICCWFYNCSAAVSGSFAIFYICLPCLPCLLSKRYF